MVVGVWLLVVVDNLRLRLRLRLSLDLRLRLRLGFHLRLHVGGLLNDALLNDRLRLRHRLRGGVTLLHRLSKHSHGLGLNAITVSV